MSTQPKDIVCKSESQVRCDPVHQNVPMLVHGGKLVTESMVIVYYIDERWAQNSLLPQHVPERAVVRSWAKFIDEKSIPMMAFFRHVGKSQEKATSFSPTPSKLWKRTAFGRNKKFFGGEDIVGVKFVKDIVGVKFVKAETLPLLQEWMDNFKQVSVIKSSLPDYERALHYFRGKRDVHQSSNYKK